MHAPTLAIARLHARASTREPVIARLATEALAAEVSAALPPLAPQSVLLLRRLALELPPRALERLPDARLRLHVAHAARGAIADAAAHAGRPALGPVADDALAVWFGDEAELLACLARDALDGRLERWWWRQLLGRAHPDWVSAWVDRPAPVAVALRLLQRAGLLAAVLKALAPRGVLANLPAAPPTAPAREQHACGIDSAAAMPARPPPASPPLAAQRQAGSTALADAHAAVPAGAMPARRARETGDSAPARQVPLRDAALAQGSPPTPAPDGAAVPSQAGEQSAVAPPATHSGAIAADVPVPEQRPVRAPQPAQAAPMQHPAGAELEQQAPLEPGGAPAAAPAASPAPHASESAPAAAPIRRSTPPAVADMVAAPTPARTRTIGGEGPLRPVHHEQAGRATDIDANAPAHVAALDAAPHVLTTRYGRLLFLVNLLLGDGLYPDFTRPLDPAFPLPLWRLLMLIGHSLIGPSLRADPLWSLLERLGDEGAHAGAARDLERHWPVPAPQRSQRLRAARRQARPANLRFPHPRRLRHTPAGSLARWLARYLHVLRSRLAPALGVEPALVGRAFAGGIAQLWVSEAELVLVTPLDAHPVAWRLAGLDRDPGPLPGAGRSLRLVFE